MSDLALTKIAAGVYEVDADTTIEKQYGEWRIINDPQSCFIGFTTLRDARNWLADHYNREGS